jgi:hypothetical protein
MGKGVHERWNEEVSGSGDRREWEPDGNLRNARRVYLKMLIWYFDGLQNVDFLSYDKQMKFV